MIGSDFEKNFTKPIAARFNECYQVHSNRWPSVPIGDCLTKSHDPKSNRDRESQRAAARTYALASQFTALLLAGVAMGIIIDRQWNTEPWGLVVCGFVGLGAGLYDLVRHADK